MVEAVEWVTEEVSTEGLCLMVRRRGVVRKVLSMESGMEIDPGPIQRLVGPLSKQELCKYPIKIGGRGRVDMTIALFLDHMIIRIMVSIKAGHLRDRFLRAILAA